MIMNANELFDLANDSCSEEIKLLGEVMQAKAKQGSLSMKLNYILPEFTQMFLEKLKCEIYVDTHNGEISTTISWREAAVYE